MKIVDPVTDYQIQEGYKVPLKAIRDAISTVLATKGVVIDNSEENKLAKVFNKHGCAIGFFRYKELNEPGDDKMRMRVFHYSDQTLQSNFGQSTDFVRALLGVISRKKVYSQFDHLDHFRKFHRSNDSMSLYHLEFNEEDIIEFCPKQETVSFLDKRKKKEVIRWNKLLADLKKPNSQYYRKYCKQLDHLLFSSGMKEVYIIPVPILSSPSILVFFNAETVKELGLGKREVYKLIREILWKVSDAIFFHLYNRLIVQFTEEPGSFIQLEKIRSEQELFSEFIKSIAHILLPTKYKVDKEKEVPFFNWYGDDKKITLHNVEINFTSKRKKRFEHEKIFEHKVRFELPNYMVPVRSHSGQLEFSMRVDRDESKNFTSFDYWEQENKFRLTLQNLYRLIYSYWESVRESKDFIANTLKPSLQKVTQISDLIKIGEFTEAVETLNTNIEALTKGQITRPNSFYQVEKSNASKKNEYRLLFMNEPITVVGVPYYHLYDVLTTNTTSIEELPTYQEYSDGKRQRKINKYEKSKQILIDQFKSLSGTLESAYAPLMRVYNDFTTSESAPRFVADEFEGNRFTYQSGNSLDFELFLRKTQTRRLFFFFAIYYKKTVDVKIKLRKVFGVDMKIPKLEFNSDRISNLVDSIENGVYADEFMTFKATTDNKFNISEVELPTLRNFAKDYRASVEKALNEIVSKHPNGQLIRQLILEAKLATERLNGTLLFSSTSIKSFERSYFESWNFRKN